VPVEQAGGRHEPHGVDGDMQVGRRAGHATPGSWSPACEVTAVM
jgi:hypothetical protein